MKSIKFGEAVSILLIMLVILGTAVIKFGLSPQIPVLFVIALIMLWAKLRGASWDDLHKGIQDGIGTAIIPIFIFILIGALIAVWIKAGIIPSIMVIGFKIISARWFVPSTFLVCSLVGVSIGSGFTTISTIGLALFAVGHAMGINPALIAGSIISGAVFGDKMSPLSDSTNLASAIAGSDLFAHIKNMMWSTIPSFIVSFILFDVYLPDQNIWLKRDAIEDIAKTFDIDAVPIVLTGTLKDGIDFVKTFPKSTMGTANMEGVVGKPKVDMLDRMGRRIIVKIKCSDFR